MKSSIGLALLLFSMTLLVLFGTSSSLIFKDHSILAQPYTGTTAQSSSLSPPGKELSSSPSLSMLLLNQVKTIVLKHLGNKSNTISIVVGVVSPNDTDVSGYGNISKANNTRVNGNTIFGIGSITKTFTTTLLADMVKQGLVNLDDPIEKDLPANVKVQHTIAMGIKSHSKI
jgi:CubicO group peptidase (beta-lactamase class C family)